MDFAPNVTPRYRVRYVSAGIAHSWTFRAARGSNPGDVQNSVNTLLEALEAALLDVLPGDFHATAADYAVEDSDVFSIPLIPPTFNGGENAVSAYSPFQRITEATFKGRGNGSKGSFGIFGVFVNQSTAAGYGGNGRIDLGESAIWDAALAVLQGSTSLYTIANAPISWYNFITVKPNDHWVKKVRTLFP